MNATTKPEPTAAKAYAACRIEVARMMGELKTKLDKNAHRMKIIQMELDKHDAAHLADSKNWAMNAITKPEPTAAEAYAARRIEVARMMSELKTKLYKNAHRMKIIRMGLDKQDAAHIADSKNCGHVASLHEFQSELLNLIGFVSDLDQKVDSFLNDTE